MRRSAGPFVAGAGVQTDKTAEALREFFNEFALIQKAVASDELTKAKNYVALSLPAEFETMSDLSSRLEEMIIYDLAEDYYEKYIENIQNVTADNIQRAAATYIQAARFAVVIVGDRKAIEAGVRELKLGPVRVLSVEQAIP
jgi:predicted Zn-dependent peptidase